MTSADLALHLAPMTLEEFHAFLEETNEELKLVHQSNKLLSGRPELPVQDPDD